MNRFTTQAALAAAAVLAVAGLGVAHAQETRTLAAGAVPAAASLDAMKGMVGNWTTAEGAAAWSAPVGGEIVGHLALTDDKGAPRVEELWIFKSEGGSLVLHQKIMDGALVEREPKDQFEVRRLIAVNGGKLYFENMTVAPMGDTLELTVNRGAAGLLKVDFKRVK